MHNRKKEPELLNTYEASAYFRVSEQTIRQWCRDDVIPYYRLGKLYRFKLEELKAIKTKGKQA